MNEYIEKLTNGWVILLLRVMPRTQWLFMSEKEVENFDMSNLNGFLKIKPRDKREIMKHVRSVAHSDDLDSRGLPIVSIYAHKDTEILRSNNG